MRYKWLFITTTIYFLLINTTYYWEGMLGMWAMVEIPLLCLVFLTLVIQVCRQIYFSAREKFEDRQRVVLAGYMIMVLGLSLFFPRGFVDFGRLNGKDLLVAQREGVANCMTTLVLKENGTFRELNVCFGITTITGTYSLKGDTIFFHNVLSREERESYYRYALVKYWDDKIEKSYLACYNNYPDTLEYSLGIIKNDLIK